MDAIVAALAGGIAAIVVTALSVSSLTIGGGTAITKVVRATANVDVQSMAANGTTSTNVTLTGAAVGDECVVSVTAGDYLSTTSTGLVACRISATNNALLIFRNTSSTAAFDAGASTFSVKSTAF